MSRLRTAIIVYGVLNAAAYSCLLPLWEGFDEGYHYGYVQSLSATGNFPVLGQAWLSREIWRSYELVPVSHYLQPFTKAPMNFEEYFALNHEERVRRRAELAVTPTDALTPQLDKPNYEVNQAPLTYLFMAPVDRLLSAQPLTIRVLWLRLLCSVAGVLLLAHATGLLADELSLAEPYTSAALFCIFSSQMLYATLCRVSNDWLAPAVMAYLLYACIRAHWGRLGLALAAGLLTKAYFLFLIPLPLALWRRKASLLWCLIAVPWYVRNLVLYHNLSGTVESTSGLGIRQAFTAALSMPWRASIYYMANSGLWTGNNSFTTFSSATLNVMLLLLAAGALLFVTRPKQDAAGWLTLAGIGLFSAGLALTSVAFYTSSHGGAIAAVPWYSQVLLAPLVLISFAGMARVRWLAVITTLLWSYVLTATYLVKLIPLYGGYSISRTRPGQLWRWYADQAAGREDILSTICLAPPPLIWAMIACATALSISIAGINAQRIMTRRVRGPER